MSINFDDPATWWLKYPIIAHDVGRTNDRSTAVIGGTFPYRPGVVGIKELIELPQGLYGSDLANVLAEIDRRYGNDALIVADLSSDATYGEVLHDTFGKRVVGVQIGAHGDGSTFEIRRVRNGAIQVCQVGRTALFQTLLRECRSNTIRLPQGPMGKRAFQQLVDLEVQAKENRDIYKCLPGKHDDLAISCAILVWAARHPRLGLWLRPIEDRHRPRPRRPQGDPWKAFV